MRKAVLIALICSVSSILVAQSVKQKEEVTGLKNQVYSLKAKNLSLEKNINILKISIDSLKAGIKESSQKILTIDEMVTAKLSEMSKTRTLTNMNAHSLKTRKTVFYIGLVIVIIALFGVYLFFVNKNKNDKLKTEALILNTKELIESEVGKVKKEFQDQVIYMKENMERKIKDIVIHSK